MSETGATQRVRLAASTAGCRLWRNNVGAGALTNGSYIRWGLANETPAMNSRIKSADLIGIRPVRITAEHVGQVFGVFLSREVKQPGWRYTGAGREEAQMRWVELVQSLGGDAGFTTGEF